MRLERPVTWHAENPSAAEAGWPSTRGQDEVDSWSLLGLKSRADPLVQQRRQLCWRCPQRVDHGLGGDVAMLLARVLIDELEDDPFIQSWCAQCRCYLPLKTRMGWANCPLGYW